MHVLRRRAARGRNHQLAPVLVHQHDGAHRRIHGLGHHLGDRLQNAVQIALGGDRLRHGRQSFHALHGADGLLGQARFRNHAAHLLADEAHQRHLVRCVPVRLFVMHVDDADQVAAADERHRKESRESVFGQRLEWLEPVVGRGGTASGRDRRGRDRRGGPGGQADQAPLVEGLAAGGNLARMSAVSAER